MGKSSCLDMKSQFTKNSVTCPFHRYTQQNGLPPTKQPQQAKKPTSPHSPNKLPQSTEGIDDAHITGAGPS